MRSNTSDARALSLSFQLSWPVFCYQSIMGLLVCCLCLSPFRELVVDSGFVLHNTTV